MNDSAQLLSVIHDRITQLAENCEQLEGFVAQGIEEIRKGEIRLQSQFEQVRNEPPPFDEVTLHDLRSPLNLIIGFAEVLLDELESPLSAPQRDALKALLKAGTELSMFIDQHYDENGDGYIT